MRKIALIIMAFFVVSCFGYVDSLYFDIYNAVTQAVVESIQVTLDTAGTEDDTVFTDSNGQAGFLLDKDETYLFRFYKRGLYYKDSLSFGYVASDTTAGKDTVTITMKYFLDPVGAKYNIVAYNNSDNDTIFKPVDSMYVDIVNSTDDTLFSGYTDSLGNFPIDPDSLTNDAVYWAYVTDADSVYVNDYVVWTHSAGTEKNIGVEMDSLSSLTPHTITANVVNWNGYPVSGITARATLKTPASYGSGTSTKWAANSTQTRSYRSDSDGVISIIIPGDGWVDISIPECNYIGSAYFTQDSTLGQLQSN